MFNLIIYYIYICFINFAFIVKCEVNFDKSIHFFVFHIHSTKKYVQLLQMHCSLIHLYTFSPEVVGKMSCFFATFGVCSSSITPLPSTSWGGVDRNEGTSTLYALLENDRDRIFPRTFDFVTVVDGKEAQQIPGLASYGSNCMVHLCTTKWIILPRWHVGVATGERYQSTNSWSEWFHIIPKFRGRFMVF